MKLFTSALIVICLLISIPHHRVVAQPPQQVVDHFKMLFFCKKRADLTDAAFKDWVLNTHVPIVKAFKGIRGYVQNFVLQPTEDFPYDLVVEIWFDQAEDFQAAMASELGQQALADIPNGLAESPIGMEVFEVAITDPPLPKASRQGQFKAIWIANHHPELDYRDYMLGQLMTYAPLAKRFPGMNGYTLHFTKAPEDPDRVASLLVNTWFDSEEAMTEAFTSRADLMDRLKGKQSVLLEKPAVMFPIEAHVLVEPPSYRGGNLTK